MKFSIEKIDLKQIAESGQCFRWKELAPGKYGIAAYGRSVIVGQQIPGELVLDCTTGDWMGVWAYYFDAATDYGSIIKRIDQRDEYLTHAARHGDGIRILRQDPWETIASFIISQNNSIPRIKRTIEALCERHGATGVHHGFGEFEYHHFPSAAALAAPHALDGLGLGYRDKYLAAIAKSVAGGEFDLNKLIAADYAEAREMLKSVYGIGDKVADCICLFGLGHHEAFPTDRWISRMAEEHYNGKFPISQYPDCAGIMQQYIFHYEITNK
ncbi:MAG: DNA glycosylase [Bacteroides sp.]